jgi:hypothetical protein
MQMNASAETNAVQVWRVTAYLTAS